ncbi:hypothetical protein GCM10007108_14990 [Thermogymnomonas acidicola]|uniref:Uncharacterized protein n=1 Tax=Thermogymnomonas acidicola TaxID=399579 RepID=A0AA37F9V7_9ARCH|nr:hypothetical protein [Thermogymnomonas acidicola]GGM77828.1 hypothetical protein GCM10007108_14990 [Thermogymnomonas acidicola]
MAPFFRRNREEKERSVERVVEVKTVGDIPPVVETRKLTGDGELKEASVKAYKYARDDFCRYFGVSMQRGEGNRHFFIRLLRDIGVDVPEEALVDSKALTTAIAESQDRVDEKSRPRYNAVRKLVSIYLDFYETSRFSSGEQISGEQLVERLMDFYNYLDIMKLYFPDTGTGRGGG